MDQPKKTSPSDTGPNPAATVQASRRDIHYTPPEVARQLVSFVADLRPSIVADLAVGKGDLLFEAERLWPRAKYLATDVDESAIRWLRRVRTAWNVGKCDIRSYQSRQASRVLKEAEGSVSLLLLNPPFTCRGGTRFEVPTPEGTLYASTAVSFMMIAASYLDPNGTAVSVLPSGCLHSLRDAAAWDHIRTKYSVSVLSRQGRGTFADSAASIVIVRLSPLQVPFAGIDSATAPQRSHAGISVRIIRGSCPMYLEARSRTGPTLVHSTDLLGGRVHLNGRRGSGVHRCVQGPAVLIPRVGAITQEKVAVLDAGPSIMLSDCVIALKTESHLLAHDLKQQVVDNLPLIRAFYVGTGAPFITLERLSKALISLGICIDE
jgi:tRNA1(Val) A37 N6-methylase TrmN6